MPYSPTVYPFVPPVELATGSGELPVVIAGAGPVGLTLALDLAQRGIRSVVLERRNATGVGSKAICWAKRTLEIFDRLGCGERLLGKGVVWNIGKVYHGARPEPIYRFDLLPEKGHQYPAFINLQQYYVEEYLQAATAHEPLTEIRWQNEVIGVQQGAQRATVTVKTPGGDYRLHCAYLLAADGCRSPVRQMLGLEFVGRVFEDNFLIADIKLHGDFPSERRFWFDPPFHDGQSALLHKQPDDVWRTDFQLGWDIDRDKEMEPERVRRRVEGLVGTDAFDFEWVSIYTFECRRMERFIHDRVIFVGDSAHLVSPFGARGGNGGIQDADNLAWKLELVLNGRAGPGLLESYDQERVAAADENILNSSRATDFMTPKSAASRAFRQAVLELAADHPFARQLVNSGRLSLPKFLSESPLNSVDDEAFAGAMAPGAPCTDAPVTKDGRASWLLKHLGGGFSGLYFADGHGPNRALRGLEKAPIPVNTAVIGEAGDAPLVDSEGLVGQRYDGRPGTFYLIRPDQHVVGRWREFDLNKIQRALARAVGHPAVETSEGQDE